MLNDALLTILTPWVSRLHAGCGNGHLEGLYTAATDQDNGAPEGCGFLHTMYEMTCFEAIGQTV
jgi:hypothetical protein